MIRELLCRLFCPNYLEQMPKEDKPGLYAAVAYTTTIRGFGHEVYCERVSGLRAAYKRARWLALKADWSLPTYGGQLGINYGVRRIQE